MTAVRAALFSLIAVAGAASAAGQSPWYVGADVGAQTGRSDGVSGRAYAGYELGSGLALRPAQTHAVELAVFSLGLDNHGTEARAEGVAINWATLLKVSDKVSLSGRLGAHYAWTTSRDGDGWRQTVDRPGVLAGVGLAYTLTPKLVLRTDLTYMPLQLNPNERAKAPTLTIGLRYGF
ncbi:outer membrane beta-barrel protein [Duganella sp. P38]|uniref:outer membrane beta-barrel protein n=1 Tax=Duganella sp. P38 TaxID=3423949 RepID=UPI003D7A64D4